MRRALPFGLVAAASVWLVSLPTQMGDWADDSWPAVHALTQGDLSAYLSAKAMMGPFATIAQAPFMALSDGAGLGAYRLASLPCMLVAGMVGLYLAGIAKRHGASSLTQFLVAAIFLVNPLTVEALDYGHPEEVLTAALAVAAIATASQGHTRRTAILLGLAVASKQWAVIAILPALMALPAKRVRVGAGAVAIVAALMLPGLIAAPGSFADVHHNAAYTGRLITPWNVWYPTANVTIEHYEVGSTRLTGEVHAAPEIVGVLSHPLIVLLAFALPLALALRRGGFSLTGADAMALLALLALLRCALDPVNNIYYHVPLLMALIGWDALTARRLPLASLAGVAVALLFFRWSDGLSDVAALNLAYVALVSAAGLLLSAHLFRSKDSRASGEIFGSEPEFSPNAVQISRI